MTSSAFTLLIDLKELWRKKLWFWRKARQFFVIINFIFGMSPQKTGGNSVSPIGVGFSLFFMAFVVLWSISIFMIGILIARKWVQLYLMLRSGSVQEDALHPLCIEATKHAWINRIASVRRSTFESIGEKFQFSISEMDLLRFNGTALKQIICHPIHHEIKLLALIHYGIDRLYVFFFFFYFDQKI